MSPHLFRRMLREEFRLQAQAFGPVRFLLFPPAIAVLVGAGVYLLAWTGSDIGQLVAGAHVFALFFGLQVGTIGLVGRDAMRDLLGDVTLLVFSARTLPLSWRRLLATFVVKDVLYYGVLFVTPLALGFVPLVVTGDLEAGSVAVLWATVAGTFSLGVGTSLTLVGVAARSRVVALALVVAVAAVWIFTPVDPVALTPYGAFGDPTVASALLGFAPAVLLGVTGVLAFEPETGGSVRRVDGDGLARLRRLSALRSPLAVRPVLQVYRSSGSVWKVAFSLGVLFALTALLLDRITVATGIEPSAGITFGTLLGLGAFTTYSWVTQFGDAREYLRYPVSYDRVFRGLLAAYLLCSLPFGFAYLALAAVWYPPVDLLAGIAIFPGIAVYVFGVTAYATGLAPNELLFDTGRFLAFGAALAAVAVPALVAGLAVAAAPVIAHLFALALAGVGALVGLALVRRAGPHWETSLRDAG